LFPEEKKADRRSREGGGKKRRGRVSKRKYAAYPRIDSLPGRKGEINLDQRKKEEGEGEREFGHFLISVSKKALSEGKILAHGWKKGGRKKHDDFLDSLARSP